MSEVKVTEVLEFLREWKSREEIRARFSLSSGESYHLVKWLKKGNFVMEKEAKGVSNLAPFVFKYKANPDELKR